MSDMFSMKADKAIGEAIDKASKEFCRKVNLDNFDLSNRRLQNDCRQFFGGAMANERQNISESREALDLVSHSATFGWLHGYACARQKASQEISAKNTEISAKIAEIERLDGKLRDSEINLCNKTREAENSESRPNSNKAESEELKSTDAGQSHRKLRRAIGWSLGIGIAIGSVITAIVCIIIDSQMMG